MSAESATSPPQFSIIIPVYNHWEMLEDCLDSLVQQTGSAAFEVLIVDDGSEVEAPESIRRWSERLAMTILRQAHEGIAAARNRGIQNSRGAVLIFTDADCRLQADCLATLERTMSESEEQYFQLCVTGDSSTLLGRAEKLRLKALQGHLLQPDRHIRYINTSGFAMRRSALMSANALFDPSAQRSEDTFVLARMMQRGELPLFVSNAIVRHAVRMSIAECVRKDLRVGWLDAVTFKRIAAEGIQVRITNAERLLMLRRMWRAAEDRSIGKMAWFVVVIRQALQRGVSMLYNVLSPSPRA